MRDHIRRWGIRIGKKKLGGWEKLGERAVHMVDLQTSEACGSPAKIESLLPLALPFSFAFAAPFGAFDLDLSLNIATKWATGDLDRGKASASAYNPS
ncbi:hypothetical protein VTN77DRAFT_4941 [Rasamsonia byssochlamydoides]|uniref:uncharacterized protein n=1 Tax=Rasamsonia byssochlamydoides TaxID=89139 RepID=UPI0037441D46